MKNKFFAKTVKNYVMEFPANDQVILWLDSLSNASRLSYIKRIQDFVNYRKDHVEWTDQRTFYNYVLFLHTEGNAASSLWTIYSILGKYWKKQYSTDLEEVGKAVSDAIKQWSKSETVKKSEVS